MLKGLITAQASPNPIIRVNDVIVDMSFNLSDANGRPISYARAKGDSYAGSDVRSVAAELVEEQADEVVAHLYSDYCRNAGLEARSNR